MSRRKLSSMSNAQLVLMIRRLINEHTAFRLKHMGAEISTNSALRAALDEAEKRHIVIDHPEFK